MSARDWKVGDKVVCIKRSGWVQTAGDPYRGRHPEYGEVCTISDMRLRDDGLYIILAEYNPFHTYRAVRFRPVQHRKTSIEIFTRMLTDTTTKVPV